MEPEQTEDPLKMHQEVPAKAGAEKAPETSEKKPEAEKKSPFELPAGYLLAAELQEMYDEDKVVHQQGHSEPESD